jgi:alkylation response protein AidB-like acyl-CoA dehydrogenase
MDFSFTQEQELIRETASAFLSEISTSQAVREAMQTEQGYDDQTWQRICEEMYWQALHIPEEYGGLGLGYVELVSILEQMGRNLLCSPFFSTACLATNALLIAGTEAQKSAYLSQICAGLTATLAFNSLEGSSAASQLAVIASACDEGYLLNGSSRYVIDGHSSSLLVVAARDASAGGVSLFVIDADVEGLNKRALPTLDQTRKQAELVFENVKVPASSLMLAGALGAQALDKILSLASIAVAAEQMGGAQRVLDLAVEYTKEREQFKRPIASFQAIKHKAADMMVRAESAKSAVYYAACIADEFLSSGHADELVEAASIAKSYCSEAFVQNAGEAIQMHGGVGFTWEYDVHLFFKRAKATEHFLGDASYHRERLAKQLLDNVEEAL